jgi:hypothetical protein
MMEDIEVIKRKVPAYDGINETLEQVIVRERKPRFLRRWVESRFDKKKE